MRPCNKAPSKSTAAASPAASPGSARRSTRLTSTVAASPAASPGSARRSTRLSSRLYGTEQSPSVSILASTTYRDLDTTSNEAPFHDISVAAQRLSSISENAPFANNHESTTLVATTTTEENFNNPNFPNLGSDDDDNAHPVDAAVCKPVDDRKPTAKTYDDDVNVEDNEHDAVFDSREEKEDDDPDDDDYIDQNYEDDNDDEEEDKVVHTATSVRAIDKLLLPDLAAFFANNENFEDNNDAMVNGDNDSSGLDNTFVHGRRKKPDVKNMTTAAAAFAMEHYQKERKAFADCERRHCLKELEDNYNLSIEYTGCVSIKLRLMTEVAADRVVAGQNFPTKKIVSL
jgi:hypothetical protein